MWGQKYQVLRNQTWGRGIFIQKMITELIHLKIEMFGSENTQVETMRVLLREKQITGD